MKAMTRLEQRRRKLGLSQKDVAKQVGVNPVLISLIETRRYRPYPKIRRLLAQLLQADEAYLFGKENQIRR